MRENKRVIVFEDDDFDGVAPTTPKEFMEFWQEKINMIPPEYVGVAEINITSDTRWECGYLEVEISYIRPETDEEMSEREKRIKDRENFKENQELCELERLRKKYDV